MATVCSVWLWRMDTNRCPVECPLWSKLKIQDGWKLYIIVFTMCKLHIESCYHMFLAKNAATIVTTGGLSHTWIFWIDVIHTFDIQPLIGCTWNPQKLLLPLLFPPASRLCAGWLWALRADLAWRQEPVYQCNSQRQSETNVCVCVFH